MHLRLVLAVAGFAVLTLFVAACADGDSKSDPTLVAPDVTLMLQAENVKFSPDELTIPVDSVVELKLENLDATEHDFQVDGLDADVMSGGSTRPEHGGGHGGGQVVAMHTMSREMASVVFMANKRGTYNFYCTISGHKEAGMVGTLTVE